MAIVSITPTSVDENGNVTFTATRDTNGSANYNWSISNGTTVNGDFGTLSGSFSFTGNNPTTTFTVNITPDLTTEGAESFQISTVGVGGSVGGQTFTSGSITINDTSVCFLAGTPILTPQGEVAIEQLKIGDDLLTADSRVVKVKWIGKQTINKVFSNPARCTPIRISAGALGEHKPSRDLLVSPGHAIFVDGILVRAGAMVNGTTIVQVHDMPQNFVYYNVECDNHELLLASNLACESFLDEVARNVFDNCAEYEALYQDTEEMIPLAYPLAVTARQIPDAIAEKIGLLSNVVAAA